MVKSVSCPTPQITGTGQATIARAKLSSLKAHRSSIAPPPRTSKITSIGSVRCTRLCSACTNAPGASAPCTAAGANTTGMCGTRRCKAVATSCNAAAPRDVTKPMPRGWLGTSRLRLASNKPSASSLALSFKNCSNKAPCPARRRCSTTNCSSPRGSYTPKRPRNSTNSPSRGMKSSS